jgi:hypothetical protein
MMSRPLASPPSPAETAAARALAGVLAACAAPVLALVLHWRRYRAQQAQRHAQDALARLGAHLLRDIGAPDELLARHVEEIQPRSVLASLEVRG